MAREVLPNVISFDDGRILSRNMVPGQRVYDEELHTVDGQEFRTWNPTRSKLGAYVVKGGRAVDVRPDANVLYLGAANGTTVSHVSDMLSRGLVVAVEFSPRSFRDLLRMSDPRGNIVPILADAWRPELYARFAGKVDLLFQDIAQRQQAAIFSKNIEAFKPALAMIAVKARSVDVASHPRQVYEAVAAEITERTGYEVIDSLDLGPYEKDHAALVLRPGAGGKRQERRRAERDERPAPREERPQRRDERPQQGGFQKRGWGPPPGGKPQGGAPPRDERPRGKFQPREDRPQRDERPRRDFGDRRGWR